MSLRRVYVYKFEIPERKVSWVPYLDRVYEKLETDEYLNGEVIEALIHDPKLSTSVVEFHVVPKYTDARTRRSIRDRIERLISEVDTEDEIQEEIDQVVRRVRNLREPDRLIEGLQKEFGIEA